MIDVTAAIEGVGPVPQRRRHWRSASAMGSNGSGSVKAPEPARSADRESAYRP
jgi:hypothetical protein